MPKFVNNIEDITTSVNRIKYFCYTAWEIMQQCELNENSKGYSPEFGQHIDFITLSKGLTHPDATKEEMFDNIASYVRKNNVYQLIDTVISAKDRALKTPLEQAISRLQQMRSNFANDILLTNSDNPETYFLVKKKIEDIIYSNPQYSEHVKKSFLFFDIRSYARGI